MRDCTEQARVAELVDALDLGSSGATRESSSLSFRTIGLWWHWFSAGAAVAGILINDVS